MQLITNFMAIKNLLCNEETTPIAVNFVTKPSIFLGFLITSQHLFMKFIRQNT